LPISELRKLFNNELGTAVLSRLLEEIRENGPTAVLNCHGGKWLALSDQSVMQPYLDRLTPQKAPRYSRAVLETLLSLPIASP